MLSELSIEELEALDSLKNSKAMKVISRLIIGKREELLGSSFIAKDRDIQSGNVIIHERAIEQLRYNAGFAHGVGWITDLVEKSGTVLRQKNEQV